MTETIPCNTSIGHSIDEDAQLVRAAQRNPAEFRAIYQKWLTPLYRYFYFRVGNQKDAEDLTAQLFLKVFEDLPRYRENGRFSAWLFTLAYHRAVDFYRRQKPEVELDAAALRSDGADLLGQAAQGEALTEVIQLLRGLPEDDQELIRLRFVADLSYREIGQVLNRSEGAVRKAVTRLIERLHQQMEEPDETKHG